MSVATKPKRKARHIECTNEAYHARAEWSRSQLNDLPDDPELFAGRCITDEFPRPSSKPMEIGTVAHQCLTAPGGLDAVVTVIPPEVLASNGARLGNAWKAWRAEHAGTIHLTERELQPIRRMIRSVHVHKTASKRLAAAMHYEFTLIYTDKETGLPLRARPDLIVADGDGVIVPDFKTTAARTTRDFARECVRFRLHRQAAWYTEAVELFGYHVKSWEFITVQNAPPYACRVRPLDPLAIALGLDEIRAARRDLKRRLDADDWSDPTGDDPIPLDLPEYAYPSVELTIGGETMTV